MTSRSQRSTVDLLIGLMAFAAVALAWFPASAQGFMVKPMRMEVSAPAGRTIEVPLEIRNTMGSDVRVIDLRLAEISQNPDGTWRLIEPGSTEDTSKLFSSLAWTSLAESTANIEPLAPAEIMVRLTPPPDARGAYFVAIVAETPAPEISEGLAVRVRFVIPVIVEIEGRPARQQVVLQDVVMNYLDGADGKAPTTTAALRIANAGRTYSRVKGYLTVERKSEERWRPVTRFEIRERAIIPGVTLELGDDLKRRLPSGDYRLRGELSVDGRRVTPVETELAFVGDPKADTLAYDTALILTPGLVAMDIVPGATRTTVLRIENPGTDAVKVQMSSSTPLALGGVAMGDLLGTALSAEPWTEIVPSEFTIRPGTRQNVRVMSRVPRDGVDHGNYYGDLVLEGTYADGQSAGKTRSTVHLSFSGIASMPQAVIEQITLAESDEPAEYFVQMRLTNIGNVHLDPSARVFVLSAQNRQLRNVPLTADEGPLLPLGKRTFSAELNVDGLEPGYYALRATAKIGGEKDVAGQQIMLVEMGGGVDADGKAVSVPRVTLVDPNTADLPEGVKLDVGEGAVAPPEEPTAPGSSSGG
jgi:hypothetical protein